MTPLLSSVAKAPDFALDLLNNVKKKKKKKSRKVERKRTD